MLFYGNITQKDVRYLVPCLNENRIYLQFILIFLAERLRFKIYFSKFAFNTQIL